MEDIVFDDEQRLAREVTGRFGAPSFMRRDKNAEAAWTELIERLSQKRREQLSIVGLMGVVSANLGEAASLINMIAGMALACERSDRRALTCGRTLTTRQPRLTKT